MCVYICVCVCVCVCFGHFVKKNEKLNKTYAVKIYFPYPARTVF